MWALLTGQAAVVVAVLVFVTGVAIVGAVSTTPRIFLVQGLPAIIALASWLAA